MSWRGVEYGNGIYASKQLAPTKWENVTGWLCEKFAYRDFAVYKCVNFQFAFQKKKKMRKKLYAFTCTTKFT